jgi:hypothetical protein
MANEVFILCWPSMKHGWAKNLYIIAKSGSCSKKYKQMLSK